MSRGLPIVATILVLVLAHPLKLRAANESTAARVKRIEEDYYRKGPTGAASPDPAEYFQKLMALARDDPEAPGAFEALSLAAKLSVSAAWKDPAVRRDEVPEMLARYYVRSPRLLEPLSSLNGLLSEPARELMRKAAEQNPSREIRGTALFYLARNYQWHAEAVELYKELPAYRVSMEPDFGREFMDRIAAADPKRLNAEAVKLFDRVRREYADVKVADVAAGDRADRALFQIQNLAVGCTAPDIVGKDQVGAEMKLSDFRGKVVVLVFWANWCGSCMDRVPAERDLVDRMRGKPFVLLGINSDPPEQLAGVIEKEKINWRSWADGRRDGPMPIATKWNVRVWPTVYVIDAAGVIRYNKLGPATGHELDDAVGALIKEQDKAVPAGR